MRILCQIVTKHPLEGELNSVGEREVVIYLGEGEGEAECVGEG